MDTNLTDVARDPFSRAQILRLRAGAGHLGPIALASPAESYNLITARADSPGTLPPVLNDEWYDLGMMLGMRASELPFKTINLNPATDTHELALDLVGLLGAEDMPKVDHPGDRMVSIQFVPDADDPARHPHARQVVWMHHDCVPLADTAPKADPSAAPRPPVVHDTLEFEKY